MKQLTLYVCEDLHSENFLMVPIPAYEQDRDDIHEVEAYCKCGRVLRKVPDSHGLLHFAPIEIELADAVAQSVGTRTEPLSLEESKP